MKKKKKFVLLECGINELNRPFNIFSNEAGAKCLGVSMLLGNKIIRLFDFDYREHLSLNNKIPNGYKTMNIGNISLYQTLENKEAREFELDRVLSVLEKLYNLRNPYPRMWRFYDGFSVEWEYEHKLEIAAYEKKFKELDSKKELSDNDKKEIEMTNQIYNMLLEDYGLTGEDFEKENDQSVFDAFYDNEKSALQKTLVRKQPNLTIKSHIKYI